MRRKLLVVTAMVMAISSGAAYATTAPTPAPGQTAGNLDGGSFTVSSNAGSAAKPVAVSLSEKLSEAPDTVHFPSQVRPAPGEAILTKVYGLAAPYVKYFPTCSIAKMDATGTENSSTSGTWWAGCPKGSLLATGVVNSVIGVTDLTQPATFPCTLDLEVYNAGGGNLAYAFEVPTASSCGPETTSDATPYAGTIKTQGKYLVNNVIEPKDISTDAGGTGLFGSLTSESLTWKKATVKVHGKTYPDIVETACLKKARPYTITYTSTTDVNYQLPGDAPTAANTFKDTVTGSAKC